MGVPIQVTFKKMWPSDEVMELVQQGADSLQSRYGDIERCHVNIERPRGRKGKGRKFRVSIDIESIDIESVTATASSEHSRVRTALSNAFHTLGPRYQRLIAA